MKSLIGIVTESYHQELILNDEAILIVWWVLMAEDVSLNNFSIVSELNHIQKHLISI